MLHDIVFCLADMEKNNVIYGINGPVVTVKATKDFSMQEMVYVGNNKLIGEINDLKALLKAKGIL